MVGYLATGWVPRSEVPHRLPGNGEGGEPSIPCPSGPARRRRWRTWRLQEASAVAEGGGGGGYSGDCEELRKGGTPHDGSPPLPVRGAARDR